MIVKKLSWKTNINKVSTKQIKGNTMLSELWHFVSNQILSSVYYTIFHSNLFFIYLVWGQAKYSLSRTNLLQKRTIRILDFALYRDHTCPLFRRDKVVKLIYLASWENCTFVNKSFNNDAFLSFVYIYMYLLRFVHAYMGMYAYLGILFSRIYAYLCLYVCL